MKTNLEGRYTSTYSFVGTNELEKQAETTFGKDWEAESDVEQIQKLCDNIEKGRYHAYCIGSNNRFEDIIVRESDNWELSTDELKELLANRGYCTNNLWHISDVQQNYVCEDDQAMEVLEVALENDYIVSQTFDAIDMWIECNSEQGEFKTKN